MQDIIITITVVTLILNHLTLTDGLSLVQPVPHRSPNTVPAGNDCSSPAEVSD